MILFPHQFLNDKEECRFYKRLLKYSQDAIIDLMPDSIKEMFPYGKKSYLKYDKSEDQILWFDSLIDAILEIASKKPNNSSELSKLRFLSKEDLNQLKIRSV